MAAVAIGPFVQADGDPDQQRQRFRRRPVRDPVSDWYALRQFGIHVSPSVGSTPFGAYLRAWYRWVQETPQNARSS